MFLEKQNEIGIIDYSHSSELIENERIVSLFNTFSDHFRIEQVLITLLELH